MRLEKNDDEEVKNLSLTAEVNFLIAEAQKRENFSDKDLGLVDNQIAKNKLLKLDSKEIGEVQFPYKASRGIALEGRKIPHLVHTFDIPKSKNNVQQSSQTFESK